MENSKRNQSIKVFQDLKVYQNLYKAMLIVNRNIVIKLPKEEKFNLISQMRRASQGAPALIAEGFAKRYQEKHWHKYINDAIGECNEMIHHLSVCIDIYSTFVDKNKCQEAIGLYDYSARQLTKLGQSWRNYHNRK